MKFTPLLVGLLLMGLTLTSQAQDITGTWLMIGQTESGESFTHTFVADAEGYTVDFSSDGEVDVEGRYELADGIITIWDVGGNPDLRCPEDAKGRYEVSMSDTEMHLKLIEDACEGRGAGGEMVMTRS